MSLVATSFIPFIHSQQLNATSPLSPIAAQLLIRRNRLLQNIPSFAKPQASDISTESFKFTRTIVKESLGQNSVSENYGYERNPIPL